MGGSTTSVTQAASPTKVLQLRHHRDVMGGPTGVTSITVKAWGGGAVVAAGDSILL